MDTGQKTAHPDAIAAQIAAAFDWWREAGVDCDFADEPTDWLAREENATGGIGEQQARPFTPVAPPAPAEEAAPARLDPAQWPTELDAFRQWWLSAPELDAGRVADRVAPRGEVGADLMVVVLQPEAEDGERLLSGPQGRFVSAFLKAARIDPERAYFASVLTRHTPAADWPALLAHGLGDLLAHHVRLVGPQRIVAFTGNILPLAGNISPNKHATSGVFNHEGASIPLLGCREPGDYLARPGRKADVWQGWLEGIASGPNA